MMVINPCSCVHVCANQVRGVKWTTTIWVHTLPFRGEEFNGTHFFHQAGVGVHCTTVDGQVVTAPGILFASCDHGVHL